MEFGLRRAQGPDGAMSATRASYIGGAAGTSNTLAGKLYGIPVMGTMAHSWIMSHSSELEAFRAYAKIYPQNSVFLIDTYDTLKSGIKNAIIAGGELVEKGYNFGVRLDSGDIDYLYNPYRYESLALALQMKLAAEAYYPGYTRRNYVNAYQYNLDICRQCMLVEVGAQTNTSEEAKNAAEPLAVLIHEVLGK